MTSTPLALERLRLPHGAGVVSGVECPGCGIELEIHQPDKQSPDRLLGACACCAAWYLIDAAAAVMCRLPDQDQLRDA
jgi:hypothetical protein